MSALTSRFERYRKLTKNCLTQPSRRIEAGDGAGHVEEVVAEQGNDPSG